jgi:hypothetical protein
MINSIATPNRPMLFMLSSRQFESAYTKRCRGARAEIDLEAKQMSDA